MVTLGQTFYLLSCRETRRGVFLLNRTTRARELSSGYTVRSCEEGDDDEDVEGDEAGHKKCNRRPVKLERSRKKASERSSSQHELTHSGRVSREAAS
ncbi:hypothetical protein INR49_024616 [Caranx melampygus]|nr:hypothetical protein INR49_024616 [Caranx melampygus]